MDFQSNWSNLSNEHKFGRMSKYIYLFEWNGRRRKYQSFCVHLFVSRRFFNSEFRRICVCVFVPLFHYFPSCPSQTHEIKKKQSSKRIQHTELFALNIFYNLFIPLLMMQMAFQYFFFLLSVSFAILSSFRFQLRMS